MSDNDQLFENAGKALKFAYQDHSKPEMSVMNRMVKSTEWPTDKPRSPSKGLAGLDGAGQAGLIRARIARLGRWNEALIIAQYAPRDTTCSCGSGCCSGKLPSQEWVDAINYICDIVGAEALKEHRTDHSMRRFAVEKSFGLKQPTANVARKVNVHEATLGKVVAKVRNYLNGVRGDKKNAQVLGRRNVAYQAAEDALDGMLD